MNIISPIQYDVTENSKPILFRKETITMNSTFSICYDESCDRITVVKSDLIQNHLPENVWATFSDDNNKVNCDDNKKVNCDDDKVNCVINHTENIDQNEVKTFTHQNTYENIMKNQENDDVIYEELNLKSSNTNTTQSKVKVNRRASTLSLKSDYQCDDQQYKSHDQLTRNSSVSVSLIIFNYFTIINAIKLIIIFICLNGFLLQVIQLTVIHPDDEASDQNFAITFCVKSLITSTEIKDFINNKTLIKFECQVNSVDELVNECTKPSISVSPKEKCLTFEYENEQLISSLKITIYQSNLERIKFFIHQTKYQVMKMKNIIQIKPG